MAQANNMFQPIMFNMKKEYDITFMVSKSTIHSRQSTCLIIGELNIIDKPPRPIQTKSMGIYCYTGRFKRAKGAKSWTVEKGGGKI